MLNALQSGAGRAIVFVHGWPVSAHVWKYQLAALSDEHRVVALDLPGYGDSPPMSEPSVAAYAAAVRDFLVQGDLRDVLLVGWSMGGSVVMSYCDQFGSGRLRAVGIVDSSPRLLPGDGWRPGVDTTFDSALVADLHRRWVNGDRRAVVTELTNLEFKEPEKHAAEIEWMIEESMKADPDGALAGIDGITLDLRPSLSRISVPALLLYGAFSNMTTAANRTFMAKAISNARLVLFHESGHNPMLEEPEKFNREVASFAEAV
jgi:non-heme chloroperoxidase